MSPQRQLVYRFMELPHVYKHEIYQMFMNEEDYDGTSNEDVSLFTEVSQLGKLDELWEEVNNRHEDKLERNPFKCQ